MEIDRIKEIVHQYWGNENPTSDTDFDGMDYQCYTESTCDGYEVYVFKATDVEMDICEHVHYYDSDLADDLFEVLIDGKTVYIDSYLWDDLYMDDLYEEYWVDQMVDMDKLNVVFDQTDMTEEERNYLIKEYQDEEDGE